MHGDDDNTAAAEEDAPHSDDEANLSQGTVSLSDISVSDGKDARKAIACEAAWRSDVKYSNWQHEQIHQGNEDISQWDKVTYDYAGVGKPCKALDKICPPLTYMEEHGMFKPLDTMANPLGLCRFYHADPETVKFISAPKPLASIHRVKCLLEKAKGHGWPYIIVVFEGGNVTLLGLLQELHLWFTLSCIPIFTSDKA